MIHVLVVDDSPARRVLLLDLLAAEGGMSALGSPANDRQALEAVQQTHPDVILLDLHLPLLNGLAAMRRIMQTCPTPIVVVSTEAGLADPDVTAAARSAGALAVLLCPTGPGPTAQALLRTVKTMAEVRMVRRWAASRSTW